MVRKAEVFLEYQGFLDKPPVEPDQLFRQACLSDGVTINTWHKTWVENATANHLRFGSFTANGIGQLWNKARHGAVIIAGSGPSLSNSIEALAQRGDIPLVSCLHNFHYMEDNGIAPEYYVTADAGDVVVEEVSEGGKRTPEEYWAITKNRTLLAFICTPPKLLELWQGPILFWSTPMPAKDLAADLRAIEDFSHMLSCGSNVLGACLYIGKTYMGASSIIFTGADFCYSYDKKFHPWVSKYDVNPQWPQRAVDIFGIPVLTNASYMNFKAWFDYVALKVPGYWINASEGGTLGAYLGGNLSCFKYMPLSSAIEMLNMNNRVKDSILNPQSGPKFVLF